MSNLNTTKGPIEILQPSISILKEIQSILPFGFFPLDEPFNGYRFGFIVKCDSDELKCLKQQPVEVGEKVAHQLIHIHQLLTLETYIQIKDKIGDSLYYATPYLKKKGSNGYESGIAHFLYPQNFAHKITNGAYESIFGEGATDLFMLFAKTYQEMNKASGLNLQYIGLDIRTKTQIGSLISGFMIYKGNFIYNGTQIQEGDPRFELLAKRGMSKLFTCLLLQWRLNRNNSFFPRKKNNMKTYLEIKIPISFDAPWFCELRQALKDIPVHWQKGYYHITMAFLNETKDLPEVDAIMHKYLDNANAVSLTFDKLDVFSTWSGLLIVHLTATHTPDAFKSLANEIRNEIKLTGSNIQSDFRLHVTLGRISEPHADINDIGFLIDEVNFHPLTLTLNEVEYREFRGRTIYKNTLK